MPVNEPTRSPFTISQREIGWRAQTVESPDSPAGGARPLYGAIAVRSGIRTSRRRSRTGGAAFVSFRRRARRN